MSSSRRPRITSGIRYNTYEDSLSGADYLEWTSAWIGAATRVLKPSGSLFLNVGTPAVGPLDRARRRAGRPRATCGCRTSFTGSSRSRSSASPTGAGAGLTRDLAVGHYKPINSDRLPERLPRVHLSLHARTAKPASTGWRSACPTRISRTSPAGASAGEGVRCRGNTWFIPYETIQRRDRDRPHPATFPSRLPEQCLRLHGLVADRDA